MAHIVICPYCQEKFDRDTTKFQKVGRRYAHLTCHEPKVDVDGAMYNEIIQYVGYILGATANYKKVTSQIKDYHISQGLSYKNIYLTLKYWYEVKKNDITKACGGIGIVPYVCKEAMDYWKSVEPKRVPKIEQEEVVITYKKRKRLVDTLLEG